MKKLLKLSRSDSANSTNKNYQWRAESGSFVRKPAKGWIHPDHELDEDSCVNYQTQVISG